MFPFYVIFSRTPPSTEPKVSQIIETRRLRFYRTGNCLFCHSPKNTHLERVMPQKTLNKTKFCTPRSRFFCNVLITERSVRGRPREFPAAKHVSKMALKKKMPTQTKERCELFCQAQFQGKATHLKTVALFRIVLGNEEEGW